MPFSDLSKLNEENFIDLPAEPIIQELDLTKEQAVHNKEASPFHANSESEPVASNLCHSRHEKNNASDDKLISKVRQAPPETMGWWKTNGFSR